tara:strand:+ start:191 stop:382 length:192 start_codon:yes stop_codon:yes gene_type:complete
MLSQNVGRIKNIEYNPDSKEMEITFIVTNNKFKKKILRDMSLSGSIEVKGEQISFTGNIEDNS